MASNYLQEFLSSVIAQHLEDASGDERGTAHSDGESNSLLPQARAIAEDLISEAITSGLPLTHARTASASLKGGNTAELVAQLTLHAPFAFKLDQAQKKLAAEGAMMRRVRNDPRLPARFREAWPVIYAVREKPPYAYLMEFFPREEGWLSLEERLYPSNGRLPASQAEVSRLIQVALDVLFSGFEASVDTRTLPSLRQDYLGRIRERLQATAALDERFAPAELVVNGSRRKPWLEYLALMDRHSSYLSAIAPQFSTVTHGDPNPGNLMLRTSTHGVELKLIDPKDWLVGDYLFDIAKITHFIEATGPIESALQPVVANYEHSGGGARLDYSYELPEWTAAAVAACMERVAQFAGAHGDVHWQARYELGMAANLLGLPLGRLTSATRARPHAALVLYGEGLKWLARFCDRLPEARPAMSAAVTNIAAPSVEPAALRSVRDLVRQRVTGARASEDRRGFQLLEWQPSRPNVSGKLAELSLEHEARLLAPHEATIETLTANLHASDGKAVAERLLPANAQFGELLIHRYARDPGAQSVDRYYDTPHTAAGLIAKMLTLRERIKTSGFMTWSSTETRERALNLELPFVALGESGVIARLEFNWIDEPTASLREVLASESIQPWNNPIFLASQAENSNFEGARPVLEHTTFRDKFAIKRRATDGEPERSIFDLNIDHVVAQALETRRIGYYVDVDIAPCKRVDEAELAQLIAFTRALAEKYDLRPNWATKAWRDAQVTCLL